MLCCYVLTSALLLLLLPHLLCAGIYDRRRYRGVAVNTDADGAPVRTHRQRGSGAHGGHGESGGSSSDNTEFEDSYVVECACGTQVDDGHLMIECESCKAWAHTACLQAQMVRAIADLWEAQNPGYLNPGYLKSV
jgi:hypothetical protein